MQGGQLGIYRKEILNWAANVSANNLQYNSNAPDNDGKIKRAIFDYQRIKRLYIIAERSKPDSILEALAHNQLLEAYAYWTKQPGYTENGRQLFFDKTRNIFDANQTMVLYGLSKEEPKIIDQLSNELKTVSEEKIQEYENTLQELNNLKNLRQAEQKMNMADHNMLVQQLNDLRTVLIQKDMETTILQQNFQKELTNTQLAYKAEVDKAIEDAKEAIRKYDTKTVEFEAAKNIYEQRTAELAKKFRERIMQLSKANTESLEKYKKLQELFLAIKTILEKAINYYQQGAGLNARASYFGYTVAPNYELISIQLFQYMVQVASLVGQYSRIFSS